MTNAIHPQPGILDIALYQGGKAKITGRDDALKLSSNENPFGAGDLARAAYARAGHDLHRYPSTDHADLRGAIAAKYGLDAGRIICGAGSDEVISFLCQAYAGPGREVVHTQHGFLMYRIYALAAGATPVVAPGKSSVWRRRCPRMCCWCWTGPMPNMPTVTMAARRWSMRGRMW